ncbi:MAG: hypothetical protein KDA75_11545 [Planctomycetaceae bacterium]|nr:hypothetical protein [Planctomycetaceae bacterium]
MSNRAYISLAVAIVLSSAGTLFAADSGPLAGTDVVGFPVFAVAGEVENETIDFVARREGKPTLYCFVPQARFSRPTARLLRLLDESVTKISDDARVVAVWVTSDVAESKAYLPRAQQSLKFTRTTLAVYEGSDTGPGEWGINVDVDLTVVATRNGKVQESFVLESPNETDADEILAAFK